MRADQHCRAQANSGQAAQHSGNECSSLIVSNPGNPRILLTIHTHFPYLHALRRGSKPLLVTEQRRDNADEESGEGAGGGQGRRGGVR